jgi:CDP-glucose 4,6-dehydratase
VRVLLTGHTGFKGSWLTLMLKAKGHEIYGISLNPESNSLFHQAQISKFLKKDIRIDIRDQIKLRSEIEAVDPDVIIHLAAQSLVPESYVNPVFTFETNVLGTMNVLESTRRLNNLRATLIITTDKVYKNTGQLHGYKESDELGGSDPYSASKAAADLLTQSWRVSFGSTPISIARGGNVIGGGDWSRDRIIPDIVRSIQSESELILRYPDSIRPWQHVLDCLNGYLRVIECQISDGIQGEWNFGPAEGEPLSVKGLVEKFCQELGSSISLVTSQIAKDEAHILRLDSSASRQKLNWTEKLDMEETIKWTADWYRYMATTNFTMSQVENFLSL